MTRGQLLTHYGIVLFLLVIVLFTARDLAEIYLTNTYSGVRTARELVTASLPFIAGAIIFAVIQYRKLYFREYRVSVTEEQFREAIERTVKEVGWQIETNNKSLFRANRHGGYWSASWGEMVTILKDKDRLLINSICDPGHVSSIASFGWNRRNMDAFLGNLTDVMNNKPQELKTAAVYKEWTAKRTLFRLFAYPFCICLVVLGVYMVMEPLTAQTIAAGIGAIAIAVIYLYTDIKVLTSKRANK